jgi:hypothetical protein
MGLGMEFATNRLETETAASPSRGSVSRLDAKPSRTRSAVTNGMRAFIEGDGNSSWYRRFKDLVELHVSDLGGYECLSEAQLSLCKRASTMEVELERLEGLLSLGKEIDLDAYSRISGNLRRILETIGIERKARPVNDGSNVLSDYFSRPLPKDTAP